MKCLALPIALLAAGSVLAVDLKQFPSELYPEINDKTSDEITLAGIAALYPGRLVRAPQNAPATNNVEPALPLRKPLRTLLPAGIVYLRCYSFAEFEKIPADASAIIDLRYFSTGTAGISECLAFCEKFSGTAPAIKIIGEYPKPATTAGNGASGADDAKRKIFVLVNQSTAGPIEPMLADLQTRGKITLVGTRTAGKTAAYMPLTDSEKWLRIAGELRSENIKQSFVATGVTPKIRVGVSEANDLYAWHRVERDKTPETVLRLAKNASAAESGNNAGNGSAAQNTPESGDAFSGTDMTFRRAYDILVALQVTESMAASDR